MQNSHYKSLRPKNRLKFTRLSSLPAGEFTAPMRPQSATLEMPFLACHPFRWRVQQSYSSNPGNA